MNGWTFKGEPFRSPANVVARHEEMERLAMQGRTQAQIAEWLGLTHSTVFWHLAGKCSCG